MTHSFVARLLHINFGIVINKCPVVRDRFDVESEIRISSLSAN